ncbi:VCBS repeat-containing protein [Paenibacillus sp. MMS20-IR301]|uniref:VCBS repeat-containing protein n=1 Tax=Paenibacillus sp. MMS20-IR301 TaxID=2895946 RepID=UPI0028E63A16|nr:VCBS repeat-containing protein [Paenibacillus sp. MMS20-IR301]WNS43151.1 VCBS repeat-containing protein [Paenibacillus sp. MMS20-IR301]
MNKYTSGLSGLLFLTLITAGCGAMKAPGELLQAPSQGNADGTLTGIVKSFLPANAHLTVPVHSDSGSAIQLQDLDKDGTEELLAFYKTDKTDYEINTLLLSQQEGKWSKLATLTGVGSELDYVNFTDVTADGAEDLLLGYSGGEGLSKELSVYSLNGGSLTELLKQPYDQLLVGDLTGEGKTDIAMLQGTYATDAQNSTRLQLLRLQGGTLQTLSDQNLDGNVISAQFTGAAPGRSALIIDAAVGAHSSYTSLLTWANGKFTDILATDDYQRAALSASKDLVLKPLAAAPDGLLGSNNIAIKDYPLASTDINGDGITEIGFLVPPAGTEGYAPLATPFISKYYQWDGASGLKFVEEQFDRWGFNFRIPAAWAGRTVLETPEESPSPWENIRFSYKNAATAEQAPLLELRLLAKNDWPAAEAKLQADQREYKLLYELQNTNDAAAPTVFVAVMPEGDAAAKLQGASLQEYNQLKLTLEEAVRLAGTPQKTRQ